MGLLLNNVEAVGLVASYASTLDPTSAQVWSRRSRDLCSSPTVEGGPPEEPPEDRAGGALPEAHFYAFWFH